jgi:hypothetical protein
MQMIQVHSFFDTRDIQFFESLLLFEFFFDEYCSS